MLKKIKNKIKSIKSIKTKVICLDLAIVFPLFLLFCILFLYVMQDNNYNLNYSKLELIEEKCAKLSERYIEVAKIINGLYLDADINYILSRKQELQGYGYIEAQNQIQQKMSDLTELFPDGQYQMIILCNNGNSWFQSALRVSADELNYETVSNESWFQQTEGYDKVYFLPKYKSQILQSLFPENSVFAIKRIRNLLSGRFIGVMIVVINEEVWDDLMLNSTDSDENVVVMDEDRKIIFSSDEKMYGQVVGENSYYAQISDYEKGFFLGYVNGTYCHIRFDGIDGTKWKMISYAPYKLSASLYIFLLLILGFSVLVVLFSIVYYNSYFLSRRIKKLNANILEVSNGNIKVRIQDDYEVEFHEITRNFNIMMDHIEKLILQLEKKEHEKHNLEIQMLQAQINPHFLHNTLTTIRFMIQMGQYEDADGAMLAFSKLLGNTFFKSHNVILLTEELSMTEEYLKLMLLRNPEGFKWNITVSDNTERLGILKNVLQPLVENSISHGFNMKEGTGHIMIRAYCFSKTLVVEVEDDGVNGDLKKINACIKGQQEIKDRNQFSGIGLLNIQMRIVRNFGEEYGLEALRNSKGGITFIMRLPIIELEEG